MFSAQLEEKAVKNDVPMDVVAHEGIVLDQGVKALVTTAVPITTRWFSVDKPDMFRWAAQNGRELWVLIERLTIGWSDDFVPVKVHQVGQPEFRRVLRVDGSVLVLAETINFLPREGSCVQRIAAMRWQYSKEQDMEKLEKEGDEYKWF